MLRLVPFLITAALIPSCMRIETANVHARVLALEGPVKLVRRQGTDNAVLSAGEHAANGDTLRLDDGAQATLSLVPGVRIVARDKAELQFDQMIVKKTGAATSFVTPERLAHLQLRGGAIFASVAVPPTETRMLIAVETAEGEFRAGAGSVFFLRVDGTKSRVVCADGEVIYLRGAMKTVVPAGHWQDWDSSGPLSDTPAEVEPGSAELDKVGEAFGAERWAENLERSGISQLPVQRNH